MKSGSKRLDVAVQQMDGGDIRQINLGEFSAGKKFILVAVPGAFTPACSDIHVPRYVANVDAFKAKGVDGIVVLSTSVFLAVEAWADTYDAPGYISFMADGSQKFADAVDQIWDLTGLGLGKPTQRYAAVIEDGVVTSLAPEPDSGAVTLSGADEVLKGL